jgi:hypothetical protein
MFALRETVASSVVNGADGKQAATCRVNMQACRSCKPRQKPFYLKIHTSIDEIASLTSFHSQLKLTRSNVAAVSSDRAVLLALRDVRAEQDDGHMEHRREYM